MSVTLKMKARQPDRSSVVIVSRSRKRKVAS